MHQSSSGLKSLIASWPGLHGKQGVSAVVAQDGASLWSLICSIKYSKSKSNQDGASLWNLICSISIQYSKSKSNQDGASLRSLICSMKYSKSNQDGASLWSAGRDGKIRRLGRVDGRVEVFFKIYHFNLFTLRSIGLRQHFCT